MEADYAVRIIRELSSGERETVEKICGRELVPHQYGYKILKKLEKGGLVKSFRGIKGGYILARDPRSFTLFDVLCAMEGPPIFAECLGHGADCPLNSGGRQCAVHREFHRLQKLLFQGLRERSLAEILGQPLPDRELEPESPVLGMKPAITSGTGVTEVSAY